VKTGSTGVRVAIGNSDCGFTSNKTALGIKIERNSTHIAFDVTHSVLTFLDLTENMVPDRVRTQSSIDYMDMLAFFDN
jgi:hypothetical protein